MAKFCDRLRTLRNSKGLSQLEFAKLMKLSKSSVNMYERGEREPGIETLERIADFFNVDLDYLLGKSEYMNKYEWLSNSIPADIVNEDIIITGRTGSGKSNTIQRLSSQLAEENPNPDQRKQIFVSYAHQDSSTYSEQILKIIESAKKDLDNNWVYMVGHDGSYRERQLSDMQFQALNAILDQMPEMPKNVNK